MGAMDGDISRHQIVQDEVERGQLPVSVVHCQVVKIVEGEISVVEGVGEEEDETGKAEDGDDGEDAKVEDLEGCEHGHV